MKEPRRGKLFAGTSGYQYDHWRDVFYPRTLKKSEWFQHYAETFDTVEINNTFYRLPEETVFESWKAAAPPGFTYAVKFSKYGTHLKHLKDPAEPIERFVSRATKLGRRLGPILVQLPPRFAPNFPRLDEFLALVPKRLRWALEIRDPRWLGDELLAILKRHRTALCIHDMIPDHPRAITARFVYLRYHGAGTKYGGLYSEAQLRAEADRIADLLRHGLDVYAYFNNDQHGYAVRNAKELIRYVEVRIARSRGSDL